MDIQNKDLGKAIITIAENNVYDSQKNLLNVLRLLNITDMFTLASKMFLLIHPLRGNLMMDIGLTMKSKLIVPSLVLLLLVLKINLLLQQAVLIQIRTPVEDNWKAAPYNGDDNLWYSVRRFNENVDIQDKTWSEPTLGSYDIDSLVEILKDRISIIIE